MPVTLMPNVKILLDLTPVPVKKVLQEMEKRALVRFSYPTELSFLKKSSSPLSDFPSNNTILDDYA